MNHKTLGKWGEDAAVQYLKNQGFYILHRNYRCRFGELDIIAAKDEILHFIEVKTRTGNLFGHPAESVTNAKRHRMDVAAKTFLSTNRWMPGMPEQVQFDVIEIEVTHIENV